jgi:peptidoglycan/LPS O-acetylase OafA/YrhL
VLSTRQIFRPEIAALRALAVTSVILFHLKVEGFQGGFVGVDVFFVISGYLITRNILADLQANEFSLAQFYVRRTRRIYPALIATAVATYIAGALWCSPLMFLDLAKECTHALLSISNIQYWRESHRYFAPNSDELALLHCWSLSLEEQFYLVWPLFVVLAHKINRTRQANVIATITSFLASIVVAKNDPSATFFLMPFRIFEFGIGAGVLFVDEIRLGSVTRQVASAVGVLSVVASALTLKSDMPNLELVMLVPCLGAAATILAGSKTSVARLITNPIFVRVGTISYSLYLCHWPIIFFARFIFGDDANGWAASSLMLVMMFVVATAMYHFVERRFIQSSTFRVASFLKNAAGFWSVVIVLVAITHATFLSKGFAWRLSVDEKKVAHLQDFPSGRDIEAVDGPVTFQLVGDSHASQYEAGLSPLMKRLGIRMEGLGGAGCPILYGMALKAFKRAECIEARDRTLLRIKQANLPIIFVQNWTDYDDATVEYEFDGSKNAHPDLKNSYTKLEDALKRTMAEFVAGGRRILLLGAQVHANCSINLPRLLQGPLPHAPLPPCPPAGRASVERSGAQTNQMLARIQAEWPDRIELLRPVDYFCDDECPVVSDGIWLYYDLTHFTVAGSHYMVKRAEIPFTRFLESTRVR